MFKRKFGPRHKRVGRFSLGFKLSLSITLLIMFLMTCVGFNTYIRNRNALLAEAQNRGWLTIRATSAFAADLLRGNNTVLLSNTIDHLERDPFVQQVAILNLDGKVVMASNQDLVHRSLNSPQIQQAMAFKKDTMKYKTDSKGYPLAMEFISPIAARGELPIGYFWMQADLSYIRSHLVDTALDQLYTSLLAILAGLIISRLIILRVVQRPIKELVSATDRVATGDFSGHVQVFNQDELGKLATAFNTMTTHLGVLFQSIRSSINDINQTAQAIINRSEQSDLASKKIAASLELLQRTTPPSTDFDSVDQAVTLAASELEQTTRSNKNQQEHLKEIRNAAKKLTRYVDRLNSLSLQFKFDQK